MTHRHKIIRLDKYVDCLVRCQRPEGRVKTLSSSKNFFPEQNVTARKQAHMLACAEHYAAENAIDHWQIDVVAVEGKAGREPKITHFENAV